MDNNKNIYDLAAGDFSSWLIRMVEAIGGKCASDVPCDGCSACCTSSQFIHVEPDETDTLLNIPAKLLFPAPLRPGGHVLLGYDEQGRCPLLIDDHCSIYEHRPRTCRTYDCRIFTATGLEADQELIAKKARRWKFGFPSEADRNRREAIKAAVIFLDKYSDRLPSGTAPKNATQHAVLALQVHELFLLEHITIIRLR